MHVVDVIAACVIAAVLVACAVVLLRQRYMLHVPGAVPMALRGEGGRWTYGIGRYVGGELRWYRSLGLGTRASRVFGRSDLQVNDHRPTGPDEARVLPVDVVIVGCTVGAVQVELALGEGAFTGFTSWLEASSPR